MKNRLGVAPNLLSLRSVTMVVPLDGVMGMPVSVFVLSMYVGMAMDMAVLMGMDEITVGVFVSVAVAVLMGMLQGDRILYHQHRCQDHNDQTHVELDARSFLQEQHAKQDTKKRCNGIIGTRFRRS